MLEIRSKHNHCRCSKLCPFFLNYEWFLSTWLSILVLFVVAIMSIPLLKDPNFRRKASLYFCKAKCYTYCMIDKAKTTIEQLWSSQEGYRTKAKNAVANKKKQIAEKTKHDKKNSVQEKNSKSNEEKKKKIERKYERFPPDKPKSKYERSQSPSTSKEPSDSRKGKSISKETNNSQKTRNSTSGSINPPKERKNSQKSS